MLGAHFWLYRATSLGPTRQKLARNSIDVRSPCPRRVSEPALNAAPASTQIGGEVDPGVREDLRNLVGGLAGEIGRPGHQEVIAAEVFFDPLERLEDPKADAARRISKAEASPPRDVLEPGLDGCLEQRPCHWGR
jgi:hypothetical protein